MSGGLLPGFAKYLANAFVVEKNRHASLGDKHGHAVAQYERFRMIDLKTVPADKLNRKRLKRGSPLKGPQ
jgi:hypothetical protein